MMWYQIRIRRKDNELFYEPDLDKPRVNILLRQYTTGKAFHFSGRIIKRSQIETITVFETYDTAKRIMEEEGRKKGKIDYNVVLQNAEDVTRDLFEKLPQPTQGSKDESEIFSATK